MSWIQDYLKTGGPRRDASPEGFLRAARMRWQQLGEELRADVDEFNSHRSGAAFSTDGEHNFRVRDDFSGLELTVTADFGGRVVRYEYAALNNKVAGVPEGGMLSMRASARGEVEFYSADERLTREETRQVLLKPVFFPGSMAA